MRQKLMCELENPKSKVNVFRVAKEMAKLGNM